jgi:hypothetical protein
MRGRKVGEGGIRKGRSWMGGILGRSGNGFWELWICREKVKLGRGIVSVHRGCWGFWARRARISVDILELGSYLVGREERFWAVFRSDQGGKVADKRRDNSIRFRYLPRIMHCFVLICY